MSYLNGFKRISPRSSELSDIFYKENFTNYEIHCIRFYDLEPSEYELKHTLVEIPSNIKASVLENIYNVTTKHCGHWFEGVVTFPIWEVKTIVFVKKEIE
jgi:hypothetical protein